MPLCVQDLIMSTDWVSAHILRKLLICNIAYYQSQKEQRTRITRHFKTTFQDSLKNCVFLLKKRKERKYTGITVIQKVQFYGLFMWFADECFYYCFFTTGFPLSKTSSTETLLTWATVTVSVHFYYNNKTLHAVTSRWLPSSRQTCSRRRFPHHFELLFCCESLGSGAQLALSIYSSPFISDYVRLGTASSSGWTSLGGVHHSKSIARSEIFSRCRTPLISPLILHRHWCTLIFGPPQETSLICCKPQTLGCINIA